MADVAALGVIMVASEDAGRGSAYPVVLVVVVYRTAEKTGVTFSHSLAMGIIMYGVAKETGVALSNLTTTLIIMVQSPEKPGSANDFLTHIQSSLSYYMKRLHSLAITPRGKYRTKKMIQKTIVYLLYSSSASSQREDASSFSSRIHRSKARSIASAKGPSPKDLLRF